MQQQLIKEVAERVQARLRKTAATWPIGLSARVVSSVIDDIVEQEIRQYSREQAEQFFRGVDAENPVYGNKIA
jgi:hypothetical protein